MSDGTTKKFVPDELQGEFLEEVTFMLDAVEESFLKIEDPNERVTELANIFRVVHSVKGAAGAVGFEDLGRFAHIVEDLLQALRFDPSRVTSGNVTLLLSSLDRIKERVFSLKQGELKDWDVSDEANQLNAVLNKYTQAPAQEATKPETAEPESNASEAVAAVSSQPKQTQDTVHHSSGEAGHLLKVDSNRVSTILELVGELVTLKSQISRDPAIKTSPPLQTAVALLEKTVAELHDQSLGLRMTSLKSTFQKVQRIVRDLSAKLDKPVRFDISGEETEIDRNMAELLGDPLVHLIRNAIDHGLEPKELRQSTGKSLTGSIQLRARQQGGRILIEICDDGRGINREKVIAKAKANGVIPEDRVDSEITDREAYEYIFAPGFSTAEKITDVSGRGVGLDVVKSNIHKMKGLIEVESTPGTGSVFRLSLPLTASITDGMLVEAGRHKFILPMEGLKELVKIKGVKPLQLTSGRRVVHIRERLMPLVSLEELLHGSTTTAETMAADQTLVIVETRSTPIAIEVDRVLNQTQVVLKSLEQDFKDQKDISGAAILGDGTVALVLDFEGLVWRFGIHPTQASVI